ncbi:hypothetical protein Q9L58_000923 [Maublancomyces gigas]|uniref:Uncharacterized protein n=1 Tax=Discina gigas TaxID=1032678 RepID=A0ABR3GW17_9PEZI
MGKVTALAAGPVGLGISLENSRTPTPSSKAKVERIREIEPHQLQIPTIAIAAPTPDNSASKPAPQAPPKSQIHPPPPVLAFPPPVPAPESPVVVADVPKVVAPSAKYPIMATLVYPTKDQLAYQPIGHYRVTTSIIPSKVNSHPPAHPTTVRLTAPLPAPHTAPAPVKATVRPPAPPALQQYQDSSDSSPASSVHGHPLRGGGSPPISHRSSVASISTVSSSASAASGSTISIVLEQEQPIPVVEHISYKLNATNSTNSSTSSLATVSSVASSSTNRSSNYFRTEPPRTLTPETHEVDVPELSNRQPNYYRYAAPQDTAPKPVRAIMDSPNPAAKRAGPWDGMPGADPNLGAYYRNAAAAKRREANTGPAPVTPVKPKNNGVDEANLAAYYHQAEVQRRKFALEKMKHEQLETDNETSTSEVSSASEPWVDPNLAGYYRAAEAAKKKKEQEAGAKRAILRWNADKALVPSPVKEPTTMVAGRNVFFSSIRRTIPGMFHSAPHAPHVPFAPPPAPTPPPGEGAGSTLGEEDGPPDGAADSWFKNAKMGPDDSRPKASDYWTTSSETLPGAGAGEGEFPPTAPPPAPTPPLAREDSVPPSPGYYARSPRAGYGYHG